MTRRLALLLFLMVSACADPTEALKAKQAETNLYYTIGEAGGRGKRLIPYTTLTGFMSYGAGTTSRTFKMLTGQEERVPLVRHPVAVGAGESGVFVIDADTHSLYRFRWPGEGGGPEGGGGAKAEFVRVRSLASLNDPNDLFVAGNGNVFISDGKGRQVVEYDSVGKEIQIFRDKENLNQPVSVTVDSRGLRIFVADGLYDKVVVFGPQGRPLYGIGEHGDGPRDFKNIRGMVQGRDGLLYIVNGLHQRIQTYGLDGTYMGTFGQGAISAPEGIAMDDDGRLYIADRLNHRIVIFRDGKMVEQYGRHGPRAGEFNQPTRLAYHKGMLYVADTENGRVQVFKVVPESLLSLGGKE